MRTALTTMLVVVLLSFGAWSAHAQAKDLKKVEKLLELMRLEENTTTAVVQMLSDIFAATPSLAVHQDIIVDYAEERIGWESLKPDMVRIYAELYSDNEIAELTQFYSSKVGQKSLDVSPEMTRQMRRVVKARFDADLGMLEMRMKNRELDIMVEEAAFFQGKAVEEEKKP